MSSAIQTSTPLSPSAPDIVPATARNIAVDAYRGFVMMLMMGEVLEFARIAAAYPNNWFWGVLGFNQSHVEWAGCSLHDMIQPSFSFLVGVALPYSLAARRAKGATFGKLWAHALWRSLLLVGLGIFLRSTSSPLTNFTFEDTLTQIGLGYSILFVLGFLRPRWQWTALGVILFGYWLAWALYPVPAPAFPHDQYTGFAAHWNKNANLGSDFDYWFLNLFPRVKPFVVNGGGYLTLSFIPTLGTMILGLIAGGWLRSDPRQLPMRRLLLGASAGIALGLLLHFTGVCPIVKRIWTPAWTIFSGGVCFLMLAGFSWIINARGHRRWAFPLLVVGANSIAAYMMAHLFHGFIVTSLHTHLGRAPFQIFGGTFEPLVLGAAVLLTFWLILFWMYRRKIFLRI